MPSPVLIFLLTFVEASIDQTKRATCTTLAYTEQHLTTFGLMHITRFDRDHARLIAELRGQTAFSDPQVPSTPPFSLPPPLTFSPPSSLPDPLTRTLTPSTGPRPLVVTTPLLRYDIDEDDPLSIPVSIASAVGLTLSLLGVRSKSIQYLTFIFDTCLPTHFTHLIYLFFSSLSLGSEYTVRFDPIRSAFHSDLTGAMSGTTHPPCGLAPTPGIPIVAQAVLHRELNCTSTPFFNNPSLFVPLRFSIVRLIHIFALNFRA